MALDKKKGKGSEVRFMVMTDLTKDPNGNYKRPATFAAASKYLPELTTSDVALTFAEENDENLVMYGSPDTGAGNWTDFTIGQGSWTFSMNGVWQPVEADRANQEALFAAMSDRKLVWIERRIIGAGTKWAGGAVYITGGNLPVPADAPVTYSASLKGKGQYFADTTTATASA